MTRARDRSGRYLPAKPADPFRASAVSHAMDKLVGGPLPYDPETYQYAPSNPLYAQTILLNSALLAAMSAEADGEMLDRHAIRRNYIRVLNRLGVRVVAPFADQVGRAMLTRRVSRVRPVKP